MSKSHENINEEPSEVWLEYLDTLDWGPGSRDDSGHRAFLRAGSLEVDPQEAIEEVKKRIKSTGGSFAHSKLERQLRKAYQYVQAAEAEGVTVDYSPQPKFDPEKLKNFAAKAPGITEEWLKEHSPEDPTIQDSASVLTHLYEPGEKVLVFEDPKTQGEHLFVVGGENKPLPKFNSEGVLFLVNPVDGKYYPNPRQGNKPSRRSEESVTSWRYLLLESDDADKDQWLSCLVRLPLKISAIYFSGNKSIHALIRVDAASKKDWDEDCAAIKSKMVAYGADAAAMTGVRLSRLPGAYRGGTQQKLLYLNPDPTYTPIYHEPSNH